MPLSIITWNINSVRLRVGLVVDFLRTHKPDVMCLQEIKCQDQDFPHEAFEAEGYNCTVFGQKGFNGVAILSKSPAELVHKNLPNFPDELSRYIEVLVPLNAIPTSRSDVHEQGEARSEGGRGGVSPHKILRIGNLYAPNGNPLGTEKFTYKLNWLKALHAHVQMTLQFEEKFVLLGDYNIIPHSIDARNPENWVGDALYQPESRTAYQALLNLGLTDALRACTDEAGLYTFWDYQAGAWQRNNGIRIDHALLSPQAADMLKTVIVHKLERDKEKPSDHVPVEIILKNHHRA